MLIPKTYTKEKICKYFHIKADSHYKRNLTNILNTIGYKYEYTAKTLKILEKLTPKQ